MNDFKSRDTAGYYENEGPLLLDGCSLLSGSLNRMCRIKSTNDYTCSRSRGSQRILWMDDAGSGLIRIGGYFTGTQQGIQQLPI